MNLIEKFRQFWHRKTFGAAVLRVLLLLFILHLVGTLPTRYVYRAPGSCRDVSDMIRVKGFKKKNFHGSFNLTSVYNENANVYLFLMGIMDPQAQLIPREGELQEQVDKERIAYMTRAMEASKLKAAIAAMRALGYNVQVKKTPLTITRITPWSKARALLRTGDEILGVEGKSPDTVEELRSVINANKAKGVLEFEINRKGEKKKLEIPLTHRKNRTVVGIFSDSTIEATNLPPIVTINSENVIGSSAGLIFTLEIMRRISGIDFTGGQKIAGTGAIDENGRVYAVEGVNLKVMAAQDEKAKYFLVPRANYREALSTAKAIKVVPVDDLAGALEFLKKINTSASVADYKPTIKISDELHPVKY